MNRTTLATLAFILAGTFAANAQAPRSAMGGQDQPYTTQGALSRPAAATPQTAGAILYDKNGKPVFKDMTRADCGNLDSKYGIYSREEFAARSIYCDNHYKADRSLKEREGKAEE